jgi:hypothetical protein
MLATRSGPIMEEDPESLRKEQESALPEGADVRRVDSFLQICCKVFYHTVT